LNDPGRSAPDISAEEDEPSLDRPLAAATHLPALDGLRGIAVLLVMVFHYVVPLETGATLFTRVLYKTTHWSWCGVDLFFVLSGFLITGILLDSRNSPRYFRTFYLRRTLRIFPLYYGVLIVCFVLVPLFRPYRSPADQAVVAHQASLWLYGSNMVASVEGWVHDGRNLAMDHFWSLALEEQFYLVWPLVVAVTSRRSLFRVCAACILIAPALRVWFVYRLGDGLPSYVLMPCRMDTLAWGGLAALAARGEFGIRPLLLPARWGLVGSGLVVAAVLIKYRYFSDELPIVSTAGVSAVAVLWVSVLVLAIGTSKRGLLGRLCRFPFLRFTGRIGYGLYVYHYLIRPFAMHWLDRARETWSPLAAGLMYWVGAFAASYAISFASWHAYEKIFLRLKDRLTRSATTGIAGRSAGA